MTFMDTIKEFLTWLSVYESPLLIAAMLGLAVAMLTEQLQLFAKYKGARRGSVAAGYNNAMKILVLNRLGGVCYFMFVAMAVDFGILPARLAGALGLALTGVAACSFFIAHWLRNQEPQPLHQSLPQIFLHLNARSKVVVSLSLVATMLNIMGLTLPMILSAHIPEYRLTLANTGFLFNALFTIINVFLIESHIARMIDSQAKGLLEFTRIVFLVRGIGCLLMGGGLIVAAG